MTVTYLAWPPTWVDGVTPFSWNTKGPLPVVVTKPAFVVDSRDADGRRITVMLASCNELLDAVIVFQNPETDQSRDIRRARPRAQRKIATITVSKVDPYIQHVATLLSNPVNNPDEQERALTTGLLYWQPVGTAPQVRALAVSGSSLFAAATTNRLLVRPLP